MEGPVEFVYLNTTRTLRAMAKRFQEYGVKPELEVFDLGQVRLASAMVEEGLIDAPPMFSYASVFHGVQVQIPKP